jgi:PAS domain S-box-containing protein
VPYHQNSLEPLAEGIENQGQMDMLRLLGYRRGQGWLFGRPAPAAEASALLAQDRQRGTAQSVAEIAEQVALRLEALPIQCLWQLQALYEGAPVGLAFVDSSLRYLAVNERLAEMHGLPLASFIGRSVAEVIPDMIDQIEPRLRRALAGETIRNIKTHYQQTTNAFLESSYQPVRDAAGEIIGVSVAVVDVTHREGR